MEVFMVLKSIDGALSEFQILPYGKVDLEGEGAILVDDESISLIVSEFERQRNDMVIDYEHQTLKDVEAPAAGWIKSLVNKGKEGLWGVVEWTEKAKRYLANKEYRYFSPVFWMRKRDRKAAKLHSVALTNKPKMNALRPIMAKLTIPTLPTIDATQRRANELMGVSDEDFLKYACKAPDLDLAEITDEDQRKINEMMGVTEDDILKYSCKSPVSQNEETAEEKVARLMGLK